MSVDLLYPGTYINKDQHKIRRLLLGSVFSRISNRMPLLSRQQKPGSRVKQLVAQISTIQNDARLSKATVSDQLKVAESKLTDVLQAHGLQSLDQLKKELIDSLPEEVKKHYLDLVKHYEKDVADDTQVIDIVGLVLTVSGVCGQYG